MTAGVGDSTVTTVGMIVSAVTGAEGMPVSMGAGVTVGPGAGVAGVGAASR
jgi:hypothetical protein